MKKLLDHQMAKEVLIQQDRWAESHGIIEKTGFLGTAILYYSLVYMLPAKTAVILGSGAGCVPRFVRQAQREVPDVQFVKNSRCILIDACIDDKGFGRAEYHNDSSHFFRIDYPEIEVWKMTTDEAALRLKKENICIDFLHIDADHTYAQSLKDFENYLPFMTEDFVITMHDTAVHHLEATRDGCVPRTIAHIRKEMAPLGKYENLELINFNQRKCNNAHYLGQDLHCCGTAIIRPKIRSIWDTELAEAPWVNGII